MRIGVNARILAYESGGPKEYLLNLGRALLRLDHDNEYVFFYPHEALRGAFPGAREVVLGTGNRLAFDWLGLPRALARHGVDLAFFPCSNMPPFVPCPAVTAMLDLGYFYRRPRMYKFADTIYMKRFITHAARRSAALAAISEHTRRDVIRLTGAAPDKITVTHLAPDDLYRREHDPEATRAFLDRHGLAPGYFLYVGNISPRKNLRTLLLALARIRDAVPSELVVTGGYAWNEDFERIVAENGLSGRVRRVGHVERTDLPHLYRGALAFVYPSLFEGFGLPVLEAMASGVPVVCSRAASLPEVAGQAALFFDPHDVDELARALLAVATDPDLRARLAALGHDNERRFSWDKTAAKTLEVFEAAMRVKGARRRT